MAITDLSSRKIALEYTNVLVGVRTYTNILVGVINSNPESCSSTNPVSLWLMILAANYWGEKAEQFLYIIMFVNVIGMTQACWCRQALCCNNVTLDRHRRGIILNHACFFKDAIRPDFLFNNDNAHPRRNAQISNTSESEDINCK